MQRSGVGEQEVGEVCSQLSERCAVFAPPGAEEERAEQHVGPFPPAPPGSSPGRGRRRLPLAGRPHARAGIFPHPQTGETHQKEALRGAEGKKLAFLSGLAAAELVRLVIYSVLLGHTPVLSLPTPVIS